MDKNMEIAVEKLRKNGFTVEVFASKEEAEETLLKGIDLEETIGFGGSVTVTKDMGIYQALKERGNKIFYHSTAKDPDEKKQLLKGAVTADVYITSTNAITMDGELVNIDGTGNRLAAMLSPTHDRLYIIAGKNKIVRNLESAMIRIKNTASPKNIERLGFNTPCSKLGKCMDCNSPQRICNATLVQKRQMFYGNTIIYLIDENLGY